jgi:hypothetical protein
VSTFQAGRASIHIPSMAKDFLAEVVEEWSAANPEFPRLVAEAEARRELARKLVAMREKKRFSGRSSRPG